MKIKSLVMRLPSLLFIALLASAPVLHAAGWSTAAAESTLGFAGTAEGMTFEGQFKQFTPNIQFDPADLSNAHFDVEIALTSADTANQDRDQTLQGEDFFATKRFATATYAATVFRDLGDGRFAADGMLSLRGVEKPVTLEFSWATDGENATLDGTATVNRLDFQIGAGDWADASTISHEITVKTHLQLVPR